MKIHEKLWYKRQIQHKHKTRVKIIEYTEKKLVTIVASSQILGV